MLITSSDIPNKVICPTSKSYAARALILSALDKREMTLLNLPAANDTKDLVDSLMKIGIKFTETSSGLQISNSFPACETKVLNTISLGVGEGGTTIRFLIPLLALGQIKYNLIFSGRMLERPMSELYNALKDLGVKIKELENGVQVQGPIDFSKKSQLDCSKSSQFASAISMIRAYYPLDIELKNLTMSRTYFELTKHVINAIKIGDTFSIPGDYSSAGYLISYALLNQKLVIENISAPDKFQADSMMINVLDQLQGSYEFQGNGLIVHPLTDLEKNFVVNGDECIDLVPTLIFLACFLKKPSTIKNIKGLCFKESDRKKEIFSILNQLKADYSYDTKRDVLIVNPSQLNSVKSLAVANDHRIVMVATLFLKMLGGGEVNPAQAVKKSFPTFFEIFGV